MASRSNSFRSLIAYLSILIITVVFLAGCERGDRKTGAAKQTSSGIRFAWVSYCSGDVQNAVIVPPQQAAERAKGTAAVCVEYTQGSYDPLGLQGQCESEGPRPLPWESSTDVNLVAMLPSGENAADYEIVITVVASDAPLYCASCDPAPQCEPNTRDVTKTFRLAFSEKEQAKVWSVIKAMQPADGREFLSIKAKAELNKKGKAISEKIIDITWSYCC